MRRRRVIINRVFRRFADIRADLFPSPPPSHPPPHPSTHYGIRHRCATLFDGIFFRPFPKSASSYFETRPLPFKSCLERRVRNEYEVKNNAFCIVFMVSIASFQYYARERAISITIKTVKTVKLVRDRVRRVSIPPPLSYLSSELAIRAVVYNSLRVHFDIYI